MRKQTLILGLLALLGACGPLNEGGLGAQFSDQFGIFGKDDPASAAIAPDIANAAPGDILLVTILNRNVVAPLTKTQINGDTITWISPGQVSMTFRDGVLIGTRGLQEDLMGVDASGVQAVLYYNPLVHISGIMRTGLYPMYNPQYVSPIYVISVSLITLAAGVLLLARHHKAIING